MSGHGRGCCSRDVVPEAPEARDARRSGIKRHLRRLLQTVAPLFFLFLLLSVAVAVMVVVVVVAVPRAPAPPRHDHATQLSVDAAPPRPTSAAVVSCLGRTERNR